MPRQERVEVNTQLYIFASELEEERRRNDKQHSSSQKSNISSSDGGAAKKTKRNLTVEENVNIMTRRMT